MKAERRERIDRGREGILTGFLRLAPCAVQACGAASRAMKRAKLITALGIALASAAPSWAGWGDLRAGLDEKATLAAVGVPFIASRGKSRVQARWTYDLGGYIHFERGRVAFWQAPRGGLESGANSAAFAAAPAVSPAPAQTGVKRPATRQLVVVR